MQLATFHARCDVELGDKVRFASTIVTEITDIRCIHYLKNQRVEFEFELEVMRGYWCRREDFVYPVVDQGPDAITHDPSEWVLPKTTFEMCSNCMHEVEIPASEPSKCPECGDDILPCSTCYLEIDGLTRCDWNEESWCWRFLK